MPFAFIFFSVPASHDTAMHDTLRISFFPDLNSLIVPG